MKEQVFQCVHNVVVVAVNDMKQQRNMPESETCHTTILDIHLFFFHSFSRTQFFSFLISYADSFSLLIAAE